MYRSSADRPHPGFAATASRYAGAPRTFDARELPSEARAHLYQCMRGRTVPTPLLAVPTGVCLGVRARAGIAIGAAVAFGMTVLSTCTASTAPSTALLAVHIALGMLTLGAALSALVASRASPGGGVAPGIYLFPFDLIDAREPRIRLYPLAGARDVRVRARELARGGGATLEIELPGDTTYAIVLREPSIADELRAEIVRTVSRIDALTDGGDVAAIAAYDAFHELREGGAWTDPSAVRRTPRPRAPFAGALALLVARTAALAIGAWVGVAAFGYGQTASDDLRFARANVHGTPAAFERYLAAGGGRYEGQVRRTLLPCAELRVIIARSPAIHDREPLVRFIQRYPESWCTDGARAALAQKVEGVRVSWNLL